MTITASSCTVESLLVGKCFGIFSFLIGPKVQDNVAYVHDSASAISSHISETIADRFIF